MGDCLWTTWKRSAAAKGARLQHWPSAWNARGRSASTRAGATRSPVMRCARRCVEMVVPLRDRANYFAYPYFSEVLLSPGPMRHGFLCRIGAALNLAYIRL